MSIQIFFCKCIKEYKCFMLVDEDEEKGGPFTFIEENVYSCTLITDDFWGDCYIIVESITGFSMGFDKKKFDLHFKRIE